MSEELIGAAALTSRYAVALVLLTAAIPKLGNRSELERAIANYEVIRPRLVPSVARWLPRLELLCAAALLGGVAARIFASIAAALLVLFAVAVAVNLVRGREIDCGCAGSIAPRRIGWGLVAGDLLLAAMAGLATLRDPGVLSLVTISQPETGLSAADGIALLVVATALVLGRLVVVGTRDVRRAERRSRSVLEAEA